MARFIASVNIFTESTQTKNVVAALSKLPGIEEVYEVAGEYDIVTWLSTSSLEEFREILTHQINKIQGIKSTITTIVLDPHKGPRSTRQNSVSNFRRQEQ
jgi:DNA-binding Lrp family transcriptional regulator